MSNEKLGAQFLHQRDPKLHTSQPVEHELANQKKLDKQASLKPADKLDDWMEVLERTHTGHADDPRVLERIKESYHKKYVIKPEDIPESYFELQKRLARERGHGDVEITDEMREQHTEVIISDQESTLDNWINYYTSPDSSSFPTWAKYWSFDNMTKLSAYDKAKHAFGKRGKDTVAPFPDLNREALAFVVDAIEKSVQKKGLKIDTAAEEELRISEEEKDMTKEQKAERLQERLQFKQLLDSASFGKLYAYAIEKVTPTEKNELENTEGKWVKYNQGSDHMPLVKSLQGYGTGWCTAGESTAETQLKNGDFYVYYSYDKDGKPTIPRAAIRMEDGQIGEVRGIAHEQNLDPYISNVVQAKMAELPDGEIYQKKAVDMKKLTDIENSVKAGKELSKDDLRFLYGFDGKIEGFGYEDDPRIKELQEGRDIRADLSSVTGYTPQEISLTEDEALNSTSKYHFGNLDLIDFQPPVELQFPETINGSLSWKDLRSAKGLNLPKKIQGDLNLSGLEYAKGLKLPETVYGEIDLNSLKSAKGLKFPEIINDDLYLRGLQSAEGLELPKIIKGNLFLSVLKSAKGLNLLDTTTYGSIYLSGLQSTEYLELPETIHHSLNLNSVKSASGFKLPETINGILYLGKLETAAGLQLPKVVNGDLFMLNLKSIIGLQLPEIIKGKIVLGLRSPAEVEELRAKYPNLKDKIR